MTESSLVPILVKKLEKHFFDQDVHNVTFKELDFKNFLGLIINVKATKKTEDGEEELTYMLKVAPETEALRKYAQIDRLFKKEIFVYQKLLPMYEKLSGEFCIFENFATIPKTHFTCTETFQECLLMDDMSLKGFQPWDFNKQLDVPHCVYVMKTYGKLHALSYALREYKPEEFKKIAEYTKDKFNTNVNVSSIGNHQKNCCKKAFETLIPAKDRKAIEVFKKFMEKPFHYQMQAMKMGAIGPYVVITHGDASLKNFLFKYDDPETPSIPSDICLLDWQNCRSGSPAFDLSQFLFVFTDRSFREQHFEHMLKSYHYSLCCHLTEFGLDPDKILPYDVLRVQMKRYSIYGFCMALMMLHIVLGKEDGVIQLPSGAKFADIDDLFDSRVRDDAFYKERVRDLINDFVEYGYFELVN